ncbi:MAG: FecR domain-containing protein [Chloroflexi bacterium]|nr:FecR domain-containing protein [Chloroflexota bacterium]
MFCALAVAAAQLAWWFAQSAVEGHATTAVTINGTLQMLGPAGGQWTSLPAETRLSEGATLRTDASSQALLTLFDYSTIVVSAGAELKLTHVGMARFGPEREVVELALQRGRLRLGVAPDQGKPRRFSVNAPGAVVDLTEGSYTITAMDGGATLRVAERGDAVVQSALGTQTLKAGQRVDWGSDGRVGALQTAPEELVFNSDFTWGLQGWRVGNTLGFPVGQDHEGQVLLEPGAQGQPVVRFLRQNSKSTHAETYLLQEIERDVSDLSNLTLTSRFRINHQSLSGGGYMGTEYPVIIRVAYRTTTGEEASQFFGFYLHNDTGNRTDLGRQVAPDRWVTFTVSLKSLAPNLARVLSVQVSASGWDYDSQIESISISGR